MSKIKWSNWKERTPAFWRKVGNSALIGIPALNLAVMSAPFGSDVKLWCVFALSVALAFVKMGTKFFKEDN